MKFLELANKRGSVRSYSDKKVEEEKIQRCLEAARLTPSACNSQPWEFIVVSESEKRAGLAGFTGLALSKLNSWTHQAPVLVVVVAKKPNLSAGLGAAVKNRPYWLMDVGMAAEHFCLQAAEDGLGTCMLGWFNEKGVKKLLSLKRTDKVVLLITLGYPARDVVKIKKRKSLDEMSRIEG
ncbi:MAG: nitroreductase family protein [Spirochaetales bacterium]|nr:nitroreductase family protein [Spirochaetales bacterium]